MKIQQIPISFQSEILYKNSLFQNSVLQFLTFENMWPCLQFQEQKLQTAMFQAAIVLT